MTSLRDDEFMEKIADAVDLSEAERVPTRLKARLYSALVQEQAQTGPLMSLTETNAYGHELCVFEQLVRIAPVGERAKSLNICRVCHARALAEHLDKPPIYWSGCPYVEFKKS
jgi:hypothetical protein